MRKIFFLSIFSAALFFACGSPDDETKNDTAGSKKGMTVSDPLGHEPHAVKDSIFNGEHIERYDNGVIFMRGDVSGGLRHGEWITFYQSGKEWSRGFYEAGLRQGHGVSYWENGQKSSEGEYKDDRMIGKWKFWDAQGKMVEKDFGGK
jgi:antitoxin component YwqK of YwqJK toxin-antitoxin module